MHLWHPHRCNCLIWAVVMWFRHGGRVRAMGSIYGWWPHWLWVKDGRVYEYSPPTHEHGRKLPPVIFNGRAQQIVALRTLYAVHDGVGVHAEIIDRLEALNGTTLLHQ